MLLDRTIRDDGNADHRSPLASLLLVVSAQSTSLQDGQWQFAIEHADGTPMLEAGDHEPGDLNRLTLLAAVRGLEAIDGPTEVTLLSYNRYLIRSLTDSLPRWRRTDFVWDHFGRRIEVQHADLWRRIDRTLGIHDVQACLLTARKVSKRKKQVSRRAASGDGESSLRIDAAHAGDSASLPRGPHSTRGSASEVASVAPAESSDRLRHWLLQSAAWNCRRSAAVLDTAATVDSSSAAIQT